MRDSSPEVTAEADGGNAAFPLSADEVARAASALYFLSNVASGDDTLQSKVLRHGTAGVVVRCLSLLPPRRGPTQLVRCWPSLVLETLCSSAPDCAWVLRDYTPLDLIALFMDS